MHAVKGIWARTVGAEVSPSSRRRSASWISSVKIKKVSSGSNNHSVSQSWDLKAGPKIGPVHYAAPQEMWKLLLVAVC